MCRLVGLRIAALGPGLRVVERRTRLRQLLRLSGLEVCMECHCRLLLPLLDLCRSCHLLVEASFRGVELALVLLERQGCMAAGRS